MRLELSCFNSAMRYVDPMDDRSPMRKKARLSQHQARDAILAAGTDLLVRRGLDAGLGLVTLNDAIVESGVPRASAYRLFTSDETDPQVAFRTELLIAYIRDDPLQRRRDIAQMISDETLGFFDTRDPDQLAFALRELVRTVWGSNLEILLGDEHWRIIGPSWASTALTSWAPDELVEAHRQADQAAVDYFRSLYDQVSTMCGLRLRHPMTWDEFGLIAASATAITTFTSAYHPELRNIPRPTGPGGQDQMWTQAALMVEGLILSCMEPIPGADLVATLGRWTDGSVRPA